MISLERKIIKIQELEDNKEQFISEILTGDLKNGNLKIYSQNVEKLKESVFHKMKKVEAEDLDLFNLMMSKRLKEHLKSKVKKLKEEQSELERLRHHNQEETIEEEMITEY